jgi:uncharacterized protein (DUF2147 family)
VIGQTALAATMVAAATLASTNITGLWNTPTDGGSVVRLAPCGDSICGRVVSSPHLRANPDQRDVRNKDPSLRNRPLRDLLVLKLGVMADKGWGDGWAYDPTDGGTYHGSMKMTPDGSLRLTGCIFVPLCKTQRWTRAD